MADEDLMAVQFANDVLERIANNRFPARESDSADYRSGTLKDAQRHAAAALKRLTPALCRMLAAPGVPASRDQGIPLADAAGKTQAVVMDEEWLAVARPLTDEQILDLARQWGAFEPSKWDGPLQFHTGEPGVIGLARAILSVAQPEQPKQPQVNLAVSTSQAPCGSEAEQPLTACPRCGAKNDAEAGDICIGEDCPMAFSDDWEADLAELNRRMQSTAAEQGE